jgi:Fe-S-cluster-containing dehydrogenase component
MNSPSPNKRENTLLIEASRCTGCRACQEACRLEHCLGSEVKPLRVLRTGPFNQGNRLVMRFEPVTCFHCQRPACVIACATGAMQKRKDGVVFSETEICIGCQSCAVACPFGVPQLNPDAGKIFKCDGCQERVAQGLWPACAAACPTGAISFGTPTRVVQDVRQRGAVRVAGSFLA